MALVVPAQGKIVSHRTLTLRQFAQLMAFNAHFIPEQENKLVQTATLAIHRLLSEDTAVDTGEARSNWIVTIGGPWPSAVPPFSPGEHLGKGERANLEAVQALAAAVVTQRRYSEIPVYITNNADHIGLLNEGVVELRPENAPINPAFVENAIIDGLNDQGVRAVQFWYP